MPGKVAVVQASSKLFETNATVDKTVSLIEECAQNGAELALFPEAFIGGYPKGADFGAVVGYRSPEGRELYQRYFESAVELDGPEVERIAAAAAENNIFVVVGVIERLGRTLYCTALTISAEEGLVGKHRKLMPTGLERLTWGFGDGSTLDVVESPVGTVGTVICWENYMPMLRQAMYEKGTQIYCAPTADARDFWQHSMMHIAHEGRVFVLSACQYLTADDFPDDFPMKLDVSGEDDVLRGGSVIIDPLGEVLAGPVFGREEILYAEIDTEKLAQGYYDFDAVGHYARPDIFQLTVNEEPMDAVSSTVPTPQVPNSQPK